MTVFSRKNGPQYQQNEVLRVVFLLSNDFDELLCFSTCLEAQPVKNMELAKKIFLFNMCRFESLIH